MISRDKTLLIRADAGPETGLRHIYRTFRIAQAWQRQGGRVAFAGGDLPARLEYRLQRHGCRVWRLAHPDRGLLDAEQTRQIAEQVQAGWLLLDGPKFDASYQRSVGSAAWKVAAMSDSAQPEHNEADVSIAAAGTFATEECFETSQLAGHRYRVAVDCPWDAATAGVSQAVPREARKLLVWLGAGVTVAQYAQLLHQVIEVCRPRTSIDVIVECAELAQGMCDGPLPVLKKTTPQAQVRLIRSAARRLTSMAPVELAITNVAAQASRLSSLGIPVALLDGMSDVQQQSASLKFTDARLFGTRHETAGAVELAWPAGVATDATMRRLSKLIRDADHRTQLANAARGAVDPQAEFRIVRRLAADSLSLEPAQTNDWDAIWRWTNNSESRAVALCVLDGQRIRTAADVRQLLCDRGQAWWVVRDSSERPLASVSVEQTGDPEVALLHVLVAPEHRNQGIGTALLERMVEQLFQTNPLQRIALQAKPGNVAAERMAANAGMSPIDPIIVDGKVAHQFQLMRADVISGVGDAANVRTRAA